MTWTKTILALYPALLVASLHLTGRGMSAGPMDLAPRPDEWLWFVGISVFAPSIHLFALRRIRRDRAAYRTAAVIGLPFIIIPFLGLVIGISIYGLLTYLLITRERSQDASSHANAAS
jgi:hypothetical protein